jgi:hypothetical protein
VADGSDVYAVFLKVLETQGISYFVTGSVASSAYGEPRFTQDLDLVVSLSSGSIDDFLAGFPSSDFYVPPEPTLREEASRTEGGHFNLLHQDSGLRADVYLAGDDELHAWAFEHLRRIQLSEDLEVWLAPPEYVIVRKLEWMSAEAGERHREDVRHMIRLCGESLDHEFLVRQVRARGLEVAWDEVQG